MSEGSGGPEESWGAPFCGKEGSRAHYGDVKESTRSRNASGEEGRNLEGFQRDQRVSKGSGGPAESWRATFCTEERSRVH